MALDMGGVTHLQVVGGSEHDGAPEARTMPTIDHGTDIGAALRAAREFRGYSIDDVAEDTRIRPAHIAAIEEMRLDDLPSRPFTIGYVRAYAQLLGLDPDEAVARFKADEPDDDGALRAPVGVRHEKDPRLGMILGGSAVIVAAIVIWNVAQRAITAEAPKPQTAEIAEVAQGAGPSQMALGAPLPAPVESTIPAPYITPGLADSVAGGGSADAAIAAGKARAAAGPVAPTTPQLPVGTPFKTDGQVYGAQQGASNVIILARKGGSFVARGADGGVYFARQLSAGEAYRPPALKGLLIDVSDPAAFEVYVNGGLVGHLPAAQTPLTKVAG